MTLFDDDFAAADAVLAEVFGETVAYHRGASSNTDVTAECTLLDRDVLDSEGFETSLRQFDFTIAASELTIDGAAIVPRQGDRIIRTIGGVEHVFVVQRDGGRECYDWHDPSKSVYVIHTALVEILS